MSVYNKSGSLLETVYGVSGLSLLKAYAIDGTVVFDNTVPPSSDDYNIWTTEYEHTILLARDSWAAEYRADNTIVPFIVTTDQHGFMDNTVNGSKYCGALYTYLAKAVKWNEISASFNLGDVCGSHYSASTMESMRAKLSVVPGNKQINTPGNHDMDGIRDDAEAMDNLFTYYFDNSDYNDFSRFEKRGFETMVDPVRHIRYVVLGSWYYTTGASMASYRISTEAIDWLIEILSSDNENDIVIVSHIQPANGSKRTTRPQVDGKIYRIAYSGYNAVGGDSLRMQDLLLARKNKTSGSLTDADAVVHTFDFSNCTTDLVCTLHGHTHADLLHYHCGVPTYTFDSYAKSSSGGHPMYFGNIDRTQQRIHLWKVETNNTIQQIIIPFTEHYNPCTGIAYPDNQKNVTLTVGESMVLTPIISTEYEDDGTYPAWYPDAFTVRLSPSGAVSNTYVSAVNNGLNGGLITAKKAGTSVVKTWCGSFSDICYVTVVDPPEEET